MYNKTSFLTICQTDLSFQQLGRIFFFKVETGKWQNFCIMQSPLLTICKLAFLYKTGENSQIVSFTSVRKCSFAVYFNDQSHLTLRWHLESVAFIVCDVWSYKLTPEVAKIGSNGTCHNYSLKLSCQGTARKCVVKKKKFAHLFIKLYRRRMLTVNDGILAWWQWCSQ